MFSIRFQYVFNMFSGFTSIQLLRTLSCTSQETTQVQRRPLRDALHSWRAVKRLGGKTLVLQPSVPQ